MCVCVCVCGHVHVRARKCYLCVCVCYFIRHVREVLQDGATIKTLYAKVDNDNKERGASH